MLIVLLSALAAAQAPATQATWHSPESIVFVELPDVPRMLAAYEHAPWVQMSRDATVRNGFKAVLDEMHLDLGRALETALDEVGMPADAPVRSLDDVVARLKTLRAASLSIGLAESTPGEFAATFAQVTEAADELDQLRSAVADYAKAHEGALPASLAALELPAALKSDPWGSAYHLEVSGQPPAAHVSSLGADHAAAGVGAASDIGDGFDLQAWAAGELERRAGVTVVIEFTDKAHADEALALLNKLTTKDSAGTAPPISLRGRSAELHRFQVAQRAGLKGWHLDAGELVVIGLGTAQAEDVAARINDGKPSLATSPALKRFEAQLAPASGATIVRGLTNETAVQGLLAEWLQHTSASFQSLRKFTAGSQSTGWRMQLEGERFLTEIVTQHDASTANWGNAFGKSAVPKDLARLVPEDAIAVLLTTLDSNALYEQVLALMGLAEEHGADVKSALAEIESRHDFNLKRDVFDSIGPGVAAYLLPIATVASLPGAAVVIDVRDAQAFERGLRGLIAALEEQAGGEFKVKFKKYHDAPMWTFSFEDENASGMNPFSISPTIVIVPGHAIITLNSTRASKEVKRALGEEGAPHRLTKLEKPPPAEATTIGYMDWGSLFDGLYAGGRSALGLIGANAQLPFDVNKVSASLPEAKALTRFYQPTILWTRPIEGGSYTHWESSFGPETWASLAVLGIEGYYGARQLQGGASATTAPVVVDPQAENVQATRASLDYLATRLAVFQLDQGHWPKKLDDLAQPTTNYPGGFLDGRALPADAWKHAFVYELAGDGAHYRLWSIGADGVDASGKGDDLVAP
jgi:hypothetical protein